MKNCGHFIFFAQTEQIRNRSIISSVPTTKSQIYHSVTSPRNNILIFRFDEYCDLILFTY